MRALTLSLGLISLLFAAGCIDMKVTDGTRRAPTQNVDLFTGGKMPTREFKEIAEMSFHGDRDDEPRARKRFIREAKDLGGNGLIFEIEVLGQPGVSSAPQDTPCLFKGKVIVYK